MYDHDPGEFLVSVVIRRCMNATEATMETARSVEEDGHEVNTSVGCKAESCHSGLPCKGPNWYLLWQKESMTSIHWTTYNEILPTPLSYES